MKIRPLGHAAAGSILAIVAASIGCQEKTSVTAPPAVAQRVPLSPEASFEAVVQSFREGIEDVKIGFRIPDGSGGHSRMTGSNQVSAELIPPSGEGGQYKGIITVRRESQYSLQRSTDPKQQEEETNQGGEGELAEDGSETEIIDPLVVSTPDPNRSAGSKLGDSEVMIVDEENFTERKYELVYEKATWVLTTKLDPNTEKSIQAAFERALDAQSEI